ncbi:unnamed protein product [Rotaria sp. Silwood2]|nr:unnamed protein product [Rotaria sp. Silwood2]CAF4486874.1 unnamed protein product [Rotaria sp. Silwood2]
MTESIGQPDVLSKRSTFAYSVGHVLNDVTAAMWLSYFIVFYYRVVNFTNAIAGYFFLIGQIADAVSTIFVSLASDRTRTGLFHYGKRKTWHLIGVICVFISFPFCFNSCIGCQNSKFWIQFTYYAVFITIFQFGWASSQVAHLAMINELTHIDGERVALNSYRFAWAFLSSTSLYAMASFFLGFSFTGDESTITPADLPIFRKLTFIVIGFGLVFMIIFHVGLKESNQTIEEKKHHSKLILTSNRKLKKMTWMSILCEKEFYQCAIVWTSARVILNVTQAFLPLYTIDTISKLNRVYVAIVPLCIYITSFIASFPMRAINKRLGRNLTNMIGYGLILVCMILFWFIIDIESKLQIQIALILACILFGISTSTTSICSTALASDFIGLNTECGAFVYGVMTFVDKLSNGIIIVLVQHFNPCKLDSTHACALYYRYIITFIPGCVAILAILMILNMWKTIVGGNRFEIVQDEERSTSTDMKDEVDSKEQNLLMA